MAKDYTNRLKKAPTRRADAQPAAAPRQEASVEQSAALRVQRGAGNRALTKLIGGAGRPLGAGAREEMEARFGQDFSDVKIHTGGAAADAAAASGSRAVTIGRDIAFAPGFFEPETSKGRMLLAHELAHVVQQSRGSGSSRESAEADAKQAGSQVAGGQNAVVSAAGTGGAQADGMTDDEKLRALQQRYQGTIEPDPNGSGNFVVVDAEAMLHRVDDEMPPPSTATNVADLGGTAGGGGGAGEEVAAEAREAGVNITSSADQTSLWDAVRASGPAQAIGGLVAGLGISKVPGGFLASPVGQAAGVLHKPTRTFEFFEGAGEMGAGLVQMGGGVGGEMAGADADVAGVVGAPETGGASLALTAGGVALNVESWGLLAQGVSNVGGGFLTSAHALMKGADDDVSQGTKDPPPAKPPVRRLPPGPEPPPEPIHVKEELLPEGTHEIRDQPNVETQSLEDAETLRANMNATTDKIVPPGHDAHHIVLKKGGGYWGKLARDVLETFGININDAANGIALPGSSKPRGTFPEPAGGPYHGTIHNKAYFKEVAKRLSGARSETEARMILHQIESWIRDAISK